LPPAVDVCVNVCVNRRSRTGFRVVCALELATETDRHGRRSPSGIAREPPDAYEHQEVAGQMVAGTLKTRAVPACAQNA
jgi:hypothetical protein